VATRLATSGRRPVAILPETAEHAWGSAVAD
jgi:hypothetical protein